ncbi:MAG: hypothetical protein M1838_002862 [Thelocarpon superellum]|nr:MAG: hypothetical protein M1838_002862 [Thelocarpon superellum]
MTATVSLRSPSQSQAPSVAFEPPPTKWLQGTWHVTHSTLPMWQTKRNVRITYVILPSPSVSGTQPALERLDDTVYYQPLNSNKVKSIHGIDVASPTTAGAWDWRGTGWLKIASSHWEILGYGGAGDGTTDGPVKEASEDWVVTYFASTIFTPAGVDIYSRSPAGVSTETMAKIKEALGKIEDSEIKNLAEELFEVTRNDPEGSV